MSDVAVRPVTRGGDLRRFLRVPWALYRSDPAWVPPLLVEQRKLLDRRRHPFHRHADVEYFLALRDGRAVGRIAAIVNHQHNDFHGERTGFFGFFESPDDPDVARALFGAAEEWLRARDMERVRGPTNFSTNEECGLLVDGFEHPPMIMMTHHLPYYGRLVEGAGYRSAKDLLAFRFLDSTPPERLVRAGRRLAERSGATIRSLDMRRLADDVARVKAVYNRAWERNWGFVPMTDAEFDHMARDLKRIVDPRLCFLALDGDSAVGFSLGLPDLNQALRHLNGRLLPVGIFKLLWHARRIDHVRVLTLGVVPGYRRRGLEALMILRTFQAAAAHGYPRGGECSWVLEDNLEMRQALERLGADPYKRYRIYEKAF